MPRSLEEVLSGKDSEETRAAAAEAASQAEPQEHQGNEAAEPAAASPPPDDGGAGEDGAPPAPEQDGNGTIPRSAFIKAREDWKRQAVEHKTRAEELARQLEELKRQPPAPPPQPVQQYQPAPPPQLPDPEQNPAGYVAALIQHQQQQAEQAIINERFNVSEMLLRQKIGDEAVEAMMAEARQVFAADPSFAARVRAQRDPFGFVHRELQTQRMAKEIGTDPNAYREKLRAELMAEMQQQGLSPPAAPAPAPLPRQGTSLATARSAAPRSAPTWTGPRAINEVFGQTSTTNR